MRVFNFNSIINNHTLLLLPTDDIYTWTDTGIFSCGGATMLDTLTGLCDYKFCTIGGAG